MTTSGAGAIFLHKHIKDIPHSHLFTDTRSGGVHFTMHFLWEFKAHYYSYESPESERCAAKITQRSGALDRAMSP